MRNQASSKSSRVIEICIEWASDITGYSLSWQATDSRFVFTCGSWPGGIITSGNTFAPGTFYHVVGTYDGMTARLYVNGGLEAELATSEAVVYNSSVPWGIGANAKIYRDRGFPRTWNGIIDEVSIFNRALSASEITTIYAAGSAGKTKPARIIAPPASQLGFWGKSLTLSLTAAGEDLHYQWFKDGDLLEGETNPILTLTNLQFDDAGDYTVVVSNSLDSVTSTPPAIVTVNPAGVDIDLYAGVKIDGVVNQSYGIQATTDLGNISGWVGVANVTLTQPTQIWYDSQSTADQPRRFYRVVAGPISIP